MNINRVFQIVLILLFTGSEVFAKPRFDPPPRAKVELISSNLKTEGMQLSIRRFEIKSMSTEDVLEYYRKKWQKSRAAESDFPPWKMIGTKQYGEYWNVQVQDQSGGGAWGYLSISDLPELLENKKPIGTQATTNKRFPMMVGSNVVNDLLHNDIGKKARTLLLQNSSSVTSNANYYRNYYLARGYKTTIDQADLRSRAYLLEFNKLSETVSLSIQSNDGKTNIVANEVKNGF